MKKYHYDLRRYRVRPATAGFVGCVYRSDSLGSAIRLLLDRFDRQNEEKEKQEQEAKAEEAAATEEDAGQKGVSESNG